jgi:hypothetical protein
MYIIIRLVAILGIWRNIKKLIQRTKWEKIHISDNFLVYYKVVFSKLNFGGKGFDTGYKI